jgi:hypothetical protein
LVSLAVLFSNPEAETAAFYKVKEAASVPVRLYHMEAAGEVVLSIVEAHVKDKIPVGTN